MELRSIEYSLVSPATLVSSAPGYVTRRAVDRTTLRVTTNWFQCVVVPLAPGRNAITVRVCDLAGNRTQAARPLTRA